MNTLISRLINRARDGKTLRPRQPTSLKQQFAMGVQIENGGFLRAMPYAAPRSWIKRRINWAEVDTNGWQKDDRDLMLAGEHSLLLTVHNAPADFLIEPGRACGAIKPEAWSAYADFIITVIDRYWSANRQMWIELWNEPDVTGSPFPDLFGCWPADGKLYGQMAGKVYKIVKRARPKVLIFGGALSQIGSFAYRVPKCDGISYHSYPKEQGGSTGMTSTRLKAEQLKAMGHKNILLSETSLLGSGSLAHQELQRQYFEYLMCLRNLLTGVFWYTLAYNGWENSDMIAKEGPKPVWYRYMEMLR